ncbi:hypothetical protein JTB14_031120 [Gonioctena quinquepunctata]|nr:hypothetical protein JTB14_031120 [Gonioctena quinquepunctata]
MIDPYKIHGLIADSDYGSSESGESDLDEEYFSYKPPPLNISHYDVIVIEPKKNERSCAREIKAKKIEESKKFYIDEYGFAKSCIETNNYFDALEPSDSKENDELEKSDGKLELDLNLENAIKTKSISTGTASKKKKRRRRRSYNKNDLINENYTTETKTPQNASVQLRRRKRRRGQFLQELHHVEATSTEITFQETAVEPRRNHLRSPESTSSNSQYLENFITTKAFQEASSQRYGRNIHFNEQEYANELLKVPVNIIVERKLEEGFGPICSYLDIPESLHTHSRCFERCGVETCEEAGIQPSREITTDNLSNGLYNPAYKTEQWEEEPLQDYNRACVVKKINDNYLQNELVSRPIHIRLAKDSSSLFNRIWSYIYCKRKVVKRRYENYGGTTLQHRRSIFVVDSNDKDRIAEAEQELHNMLGELDLKDTILLVFANKQDLPNSMSTAELTDKLKLNTLKNRNWFIQATCATQGNGLYEGLDWLSNELAK